jgi:hypothetical protein
MDNTPTMMKERNTVDMTLFIPVSVKDDGLALEKKTEDRRMPMNMQSNILE